MSSGKICFVSIRYGEEVNGGAELHCRQLAEHMKRYYDHIDVLTSRAKDYMTWRNEYPEGGELLNGIRVIRFSTVMNVIRRHSTRSICGCFRTALHRKMRRHGSNCKVPTCRP